MSSEQNPYVLYPAHEMDRRPRYYDGQFLDSADLNDAQRHAIDRRRRHHEATVSAGVVAGLDVRASEGGISVAPGAAVDAVGRQIVLVEAAQVGVAASLHGGHATVLVTYDERPADEVDEGRGRPGATRFHELPAIEVVAQGAATPAHAIVLAALTIDEAGGVQVDASVRSWAGLRLPGPTALTMAAVEGDPGRAVLDAALRLRVPAGTAHDPSRPALLVEGHQTITGGAVVGQAEPTGYQGVSNDGNDLIVGGQLAVGGGAGSTIYKLGVGYPPPGQGEGTLVTRRLAVNREWVDDSLALQVDGDASFGSTTVHGGLAATGAASVGGSLTAGGDATVGGEVQVGGALDVAGAAEVHGGLRVHGGAAVAGWAVVGDDLATEGALIGRGGVLDLGAGQAEREPSAGQIAYNGFGSDALAIVGAGATDESRKILLYAEGGLTVRGPTGVNGSLYAGPISAWGQLFADGDLRTNGSAVVQRSLDVVGSGAVRGRLLVGQSTDGGYGGVVAGDADLVVAGQLSAGGSGGSAVYGLGVGAAPRAGKEGYLVVGDRVGIGTTDPQVRLDVAGTARVTGDVALGGALSVQQGVEVQGAATLKGAVSAEGAVSVGGRLTIKQGVDEGLRFPPDIGGGGGDWAGLRYWVQSGEQTRLELGTGNDSDDTLVLRQKQSDVVTLWNGNVGVRESTPMAALDVNGDVLLRHGARVDGVVDLGAQHVGREASAGKIGYDAFLPGQHKLELVGGGTTPSNRRIHLWAEGGVEINGDRLALRGEPVARSKGAPVRIVRGTVKSTGERWAGEGFDSMRYQINGTYQTGVYWINFHTAFSGRPTVVVTQHYPNDTDSDAWGNTLDNAIVSRTYGHACQIVTGGAGGDRHWRSFEFIAIGPV